MKKENKRGVREKFGDAVSLIPKVRKVPCASGCQLSLEVGKTKFPLERT